MPNPQLLIRPFVRREAVLSSRIEGTQADIADLYAYEAGQLPLPGVKPVPSESDVREVYNKAGILRQRGETAYGKTFVADEILRVIGEAEV